MVWHFVIISFKYKDPNIVVEIIAKIDDAGTTYERFAILSVYAYIKYAMKLIFCIGMKIYLFYLK